MFAGALIGACLVGMASSPKEEPLPPRAPESRKAALARFGAGLWQARRDRLFSAIRSLEAAAKRDPNSTAPLKELISVYARIGREPDAIRTARSVLEREPKDAITAHALARLLDDAGEFAEAASFAKVAAENIDAAAHPEKALAIYRDLAILRAKKGDAAGAASACQMAVDLLTRKRKTLIASAAMTPQEVDLETAEAFERLGKARVKTHDSEAAARAFLAAHRLYADPKRVHDRSAAARLDWNLSATFAERNPKLALSHLEAFLRFRPLAAEPYERLATLMNRTGQASEIVPALRTYASREPENQPLQAVLASELARDPDTRREGDASFAAILGQTNDPKLVRIALRSFIETGRASEIIRVMDAAYKTVHAKEKKPAAAREFAAEKVRVVGEILRSEPKWAAAVLAAGAAELGTGVDREYSTRTAMGLLAAQARLLDSAEAQLQEALRTSPLNAQGAIYLQLMRVLSMNRKMRSLQKLCEDALGRPALIRTFPLMSPLFHSRLAYIYAKAGRDREALAAADKAIAQSADLNRLGYRVAKMQVLTILGRHDEALALGARLLKEFPAPADRLRIRHQLGSAFWAARKYRESERELRAILDADPDHKGACNDLGFHLADQGRNLNEAEELIRRAIAVDRVDRKKSGDLELESAAYLDSLAWVLFRRGKLASARDLLVKVAAMPEAAADGVVWDHLGDVQFRLGEKARARAAWQHAVKLLADNPRGRLDTRLDDIRRKLQATAGR